MKIIKMILVTGSLAYDYIMDFPGKFAEHILPEKIHMINVSFLVDQMIKNFGGTAGNISYSLSLLGVKVSLFGCVGKDFGPYKDFLKENEIETKYLKVMEDKYTTTGFGVTDKSDNQIWGFYQGADIHSDLLSVRSIREKIDFGIVSPQNPKAMNKFVCEYKEEQIPYLYDPGMQLPRLTNPELETGIRGATILIGNDYEMTVMEKRLTNWKGLVEKKILITTMAEKGVKIDYTGKSFTVNAAKAKSVCDPVGAGDAFRGGFMAGFMRNFSLPVCARMGAVAAVYTVEKYGTTTHKYTIEDFCRRYKENYKESLSL
ncbi:MAG: Adenosine kinase [Candidatus Gottesmanbacteria bacterium GW2011_GWC2_39_8]|uniref:Adenosine kinase n=1 Tax=Candidatus Gottesmanbacteria bacterium GW2011_GWC2_39_8 TaxID=1618450 RepID=A0A0G0QA71_9BACT|nr:MAG: Adenosine kinase [Candidatus Gottesmanbacteria bacterium GW2011_GWC2_39_8]